MAPTPVKANGKQCLVYELHLTNFFTNKLERFQMEMSNASSELIDFFIKKHGGTQALGSVRH